jgi:3-oxoacid CoA-transferase subunit A
VDKLQSSASTALADLIHDGMTIAVGGFGLCGIPYDLIEVVRDSGATSLTIVSNNMGVDGKGLSLLLENHQVSKVLSSYVGENNFFAEQYLSGNLDVEFVPQGTLAERMRAGGAGIPAFYTRTGVGTTVAENKPHTEIDGVTYILERAIVADLALVRAHQADRKGNLTYRLAARNFNPVVATCGRVTVAEAQTVVSGYLNPDRIVTPGIFIDRVVQATQRVKDIEKVTVRARGAMAAS